MRLWLALVEFEALVKMGDDGNAWPILKEAVAPNISVYGNGDHSLILRIGVSMAEVAERAGHHDDAVQMCEPLLRYLSNNPDVSFKTDRDIVERILKRGQIN